MDTSIASFTVVELMANNEYLAKRIGYIAAGFCLKEDTEALTLCVNILKKDIFHRNHYLVASVLSSVCLFMSHDLARNIYNDIYNQLTSSLSHIRKHAVITLYKIYKKFPESMSPTIQRLIGCLDDKSPGVRLATINVLLELVYDYPGDFLEYASVLFKIINNPTTAQTSSWMTVKIIQVLKEFSYVDTKVKKAFIPILVNLLTNTNTTLPIVIEVNATLLDLCPENGKIVMMCCEKTVNFFQKNDNNLKYCSLEQLNKVVKTNPDVVLKISAQLLDLLKTNDISIQTRAVSVLLNLLTKDSFDRIMNYLRGFIIKLSHDNPRSKKRFVEFLINSCIDVCYANNFALVPNLEWYVDFLLEIANICVVNYTTTSGELISAQLLDLVIRVKALRQYIIPQMACFVENINNIFENNSQSVIRKNFHIGTSNHIINVCVFCCGEYFEFLENPITFVDIIMRKSCMEFSEDIQASIVNTAGKIVCKLLGKVFSQDIIVQDSVKLEVISYAENVFQEKFSSFVVSPHIRINILASCYTALLKCVIKNYHQGNNCFTELNGLFQQELQSIAPNVQRKVIKPKGLNLDKWINKNADPALKKKKKAKKIALIVNATKQTNTASTTKHTEEQQTDFPNLFNIGQKKTYELKSYEIAPINTYGNLMSPELTPKNEPNLPQFIHRYSGLKNDDIVHKDKLVFKNQHLTIGSIVSNSKKVPTRLIVHLNIRNCSNSNLTDVKLSLVNKCVDVVIENASKTSFVLEKQKSCKKRIAINTEKSKGPFQWEINLVYKDNNNDNQINVITMTLPVHLFFQIEEPEDISGRFTSLITDQSDSILTKQLQHNKITTILQFKDCFHEFLSLFNVDDQNYYVPLNEPSSVACISLNEEVSSLTITIRSYSSDLNDHLHKWLSQVKAH